jgi:hypothetical protein
MSEQLHILLETAKGTALPAETLLYFTYHVACTNYKYTINIIIKASHSYFCHVTVFNSGSSYGLVSSSRSRI